MRELESSVEQEACDLIYDNLGVENSKLKVLGDNGFPDRVFWLPGGKPFLIEFKRPGEKARPKQLYIHNKLRNLGYQVEVHDNAIDAFEAVIKALESTRLSEEGRQVLDRARGRCAVLRSRAR